MGKVDMCLCSGCGGVGGVGVVRVGGFGQGLGRLGGAIENKLLPSYFDEYIPKN